MGEMKLMLGTETSDKSLLRFSTYASPIIDGVRCCVIDGELRSRSMKPFANESVQQKFSTPMLNSLDGMLVVNMAHPVPSVHAATREVLGNPTGEPDITFVVFDAFTPHIARCNYNDRHSFASNTLRQIGIARPDLYNFLKMVPTRRFAALAQLEDQMDVWHAQGYQRGAMTRFLRGKYKHGRTMLADARMVLFRPEQETVQVPEISVHPG